MTMLSPANTSKKAPKLSHPNDNFDAAKAKEIRERSPFDTRNILDKYKGLSNEEIYNARQTGGLVAILTNKVRDFNLGSVIRSACQLGVDHVVITDSKKYDRRGTVGASHYMDIDFELDTMDALRKYRNMGYRIVAAEYDERYDMSSLYEYTWNYKTAIIFGEEGVTLPDEVLNFVDDIVMVPMYGVLRSLNVASTATVMFSHYCSQHM